jgi:integrase
MNPHHHKAKLVLFTAKARMREPRSAARAARERHRSAVPPSVFALKTAKLHYRWHDCRHTFVSRLAENPAVSEQTIMALAGHVSKAMLARYSHIRSAAKQAAINALENHDSKVGGAQNEAQSNREAREEPFSNSETSIN